MTRLRPSVNPSFCSSVTKARYPSPPETASSSPVLSTPIRATCVDGCCARAESGHAAAPPTSVMNSRRLIVALRGQNHAPHRLTAVRVLERGEGDVSCDQLFWAGNVGFESHDRGQNRKSSV